jgi:hypothetical protein
MAEVLVGAEDIGDLEAMFIRRFGEPFNSARASDS